MAGQKKVVQAIVEALVLSHLNILKGRAYVRLAFFQLPLLTLLSTSVLPLSLLFLVLRGHTKGARSLAFSILTNG